MRVTVKFGEDIEVEVEEDARISDLLNQLNLNRETVIVKRNDEICTEEEGLSRRDVVEIIRAISGG